MAPTSKPTTSGDKHIRRCQRSRQSTAFTTLSILFLPNLAQSISLSQFQPSINPTTLTPACSAIYTSTLPACIPADFSGRCSSGCINALVALYSPIYNACGGTASDNQLLIGNFLAGDGLTTLCKGVDVVMLAPTSAVTAPAPSSQAVSSQAISSRIPSSQAPSSQNPSATQYQSTAPIALPGYGSSAAPLPSRWSSSSVKSHTTSTLTTEVTSTIHSTHTEQTVQPSTSNTSRTSSSTTSTTTEKTPTGTQTTAAEYDHCVEYESNPFKTCGQNQGSGAVNLRVSLWQVGGVLLTGALGVVVVVTDWI